MLEPPTIPRPHLGTGAAFGLTALELLQRSKISVAADRVEITAISDSEAEKRGWRPAARARPEGVDLVMDISAPRPVHHPLHPALHQRCRRRAVRCLFGRYRTQARMAILRRRDRGRRRGRAACTVGMGAPSATLGRGGARLAIRGRHGWGRAAPPSRMPT
jgi:OOP family OmpA-OmpF porin